MKKTLIALLAALAVVGTTSVAAIEEPEFFGDAAEASLMAEEEIVSEDEEYVPGDVSWYNETDTEFTISNSEELKGFAALVDGGNDFDGKTVKLGADIDLYEKDENGEAVPFEPIGSYRYEYAFKGTFDGQGNTIKNLSQNTWALNNGYYYGDLGLGLFGFIEDATIKNLKINGASISGESAICGSIAACAYGECIFENITITETTVMDYQYYAGGIVGWASGVHKYINCDVESSVTVGGQWGDFDNSNGGVIGGCGGSAEIYMKDCDIACRIDAYNDVTSSYQWYAYRRSGMLIGNPGLTGTIGGTTYAVSPQITLEDCTVTYGDWANYTYCEFAGKNWPYVRVQAGVSNSAYSNPRYGHPTDANGNEVVDDNHVHNEGEDHFILCEFNQLWGGGQGVYGSNYVSINDGIGELPQVTIINKGMEARNAVKLTKGTDEATLSFETSIENGSEVYYYATLEEALADVEEGDIVTLLKDVTTADIIDQRVNFTIDLNGHTLTPAANQPKYDESSMADRAPGNIRVWGNTLTIKNGTLNLNGVEGSGSYGIMTLDANGAITLDGVKIDATDYEEKYAIAYLVGNGSAINLVDSEIVLSNDNGSFGGVFKGEGGVGTVNIDDTDITLDTVSRAFVSTNVVITNASALKVTNSAYAFNKCPSVIISGEDTSVVVENCVDKNGAVRLADGQTFTVTDDAFVKIIGNEPYDFSFEGPEQNAVVTISDNAKLMYDTDNLVETTDDNFAADDTAELVNVAEEISLVFKKVAGDNSTWKILLVAKNSETINRMNSADFTFVLTTDEAADTMAYEITTTNSEVEINNVNNDANRYEFHFAGKDDVTTDTATEVELGTVTFTGYGAFTFAIDTEEIAENTNVAHATTLRDNIVDTFIIGGNVEAGQNDLNINEDISTELVGTIDSEIIAPTQNLTIKIAFPNVIEDNKLAYQAMNVLVTGEDIADISIDLGMDNTGAALTLKNKTNASYTVAFDDATNVYIIEIVNALTAKAAYNVTVSGAGYRTARYTVNTQETDKVLNFWNNVKDNVVEVEEDKASSAKNVTFLAGDIVNDGAINIYDLSAVVSYFGEIDLDADNKPEYAKYDLNRDGKIDSKDVAYVLVSWGN